MNNQDFHKLGYTKANLLNTKQIELIENKILYYYGAEKKNLLSKIIDMYKKFPKKAGNRYDLLNFYLDLQSIFYSKSIVNKIKINQNAL